MADKTFTQIQADHPSINFPDEAIFGYDNPLTGQTEGIDGASLRVSAVNDDTVAATATVSTLSSNYTTLASQVAALSTQSSTAGRRSQGTATTNSTGVNSDLWGTDATTPWVGDDGAQHFATFLVANTNTVGSGTNLVLSVLTKIAGVNMLNPGNITLAPTGASTSYVVDIMLMTNAGADGLHHTERMTLQIRPATTNNGTTSMGYGYAVDAATSQVLDLAQFRQSTVTDFGVVRPSMEIRLNATVANANFSITRMTSEVQFLKDR